MTTRIVVVSASPLLADGLRAALGAQDESAADWQIEGDTAAADVLVLHARDSAEAIRLHASLPAATPAVLVGDDLREVAQRSSGDGRALALISAAATPARLRAAVAAVLQGLSVRDAALAWPMLPGAAGAGEHEPLTPRELEVFELLGKGLSNRDIGGVLGISAHTAKFHVGQILAKIGAATRAEAVSAGLRMGLIGL